MSAFFFVTMILHRSRRQFMTRFYLRMTALVTARKLYRLMLLILLYVFHFLYLCVHYNDIGVVASTIAFAIFFVFMDVERWLQRLHEERTPFCIAALAAVVFVFTPHLFTLAVTISFVLLASLLYRCGRTRLTARCSSKTQKCSSYTTIKYHLYHAVPFV